MPLRPTAAEERESRVKRFTLYLSNDDYEALREKAFRERRSVSSLIREWIEERLGAR